MSMIFLYAQELNGEWTLCPPQDGVMLVSSLDNKEMTDNHSSF